MSLDTKKTLLIGGNGFLGKRITQLFQKNNYENWVVVQRRFSTENSKFITLQDIDEFKIGQKFDYIINLAQDKTSDAEKSQQYNFSIPLNLIRTFIKTKGTIINFPSYIEFYEISKKSHLLNYRRNKILMRNALSEFELSHEAKILNLVLFTLYGYGDREDSFIKLLERSLINDQAIDMTEGHQLIGLTHADEIAQLVTSIIDGKNEVTAGIYSVWPRPLVSLREQLESISTKSSLFNWGAKEYGGHELFYDNGYFPPEFPKFQFSDFRSKFVEMLENRKDYPNVQIR